MTLRRVETETLACLKKQIYATVQKNYYIYYYNYIIIIRQHHITYNCFISCISNICIRYFMLLL